MGLHPRVFPDAELLGAAAASVIVDAIRRAGDASFLLGCPSGRSPSSTYRHLAALAAREALDMSRVVIVMMDEFVVADPSGTPAREDRRAEHSCAKFGIEQILDAVNAGLTPERRIPGSSLWVPDPAHPERYDHAIAEHGGIDLFLLASGASDGHVAFNPPGSATASTTRVVDLAELTRRDNLGTFPSFGGDLEQVPRQGVTVGIATIRAARSVLMVCLGAAKGRAVARLVSAEAYEPSWPATIAVECDEPVFFVDQAAADAAAQFMDR